MRKTFAILLCLALLLPLALMSASAEESKGVINLWSFTPEVAGMVDKFLELHPDFGYTFSETTINNDGGMYEAALDQALAAGGADAPDLYCAEAAYIVKYAQGDMAEFAAPYASIIADVDAKIAAAEIAPYAIDLGTRPSDGQLVGLGYQATGGALIYRRSIAIDTWGTDDPAEIAAKVGPGWDKFFEAAEELKEKGYAIVSGDGDIWNVIEKSSEKGWIVDDKLFIDPTREAFLDLSKTLKDNGYHNDTSAWGSAWFADMAGAGEKQVFGFFGPAWLINYVMGGNAGETYGDWAVCEPTVGFYWGGTWLLCNADSDKKEAVGQFIEWVTLQCDEEGLQYFWANGTLEGEGGTKDTVASAVVMAMSNGELDFLGGQNMFDAFMAANEMANGKNLSQYDTPINRLWRDQVNQYAAGNCSREEAVATFIQNVIDELGIDAE